MKKIIKLTLVTCLLFVITSFQSSAISEGISEPVINPQGDPETTKGHLDKDYVHCNGRGKITCILK